MKKIFDKYEFIFCMALIILYIVINSICVNNFGVADYRSLIINTLFSICLIILIKSINGFKYYGFTKVSDLKKYLYFLPLLFIISVNLWGGINTDYSISTIAFHILNMFNIGFIEEVIFRGFLFKMMEKDNLKNAIIVSSITFGIGHIINLLNGAEFISTLMQVFYAISIGYLFVVIFYKSGSLVPCIVCHSIFNALSIFHIERFVYLTSIVLIVVPLVYAYYINKVVKE